MKIWYLFLLIYLAWSCCAEASSNQKNKACEARKDFNLTHSSALGFLQCAGLPSTDTGKDQLQNLKDILEATMDLYTFMRSSMKGVPVLTVKGALEWTPDREFENEDLVKMWLEIKIKPLLKSVTKRFLSCLSMKNFTCSTYQTMVKQLSHYVSEMDPVRQKWTYMFFMYPFLSGERMSGCVKRNESSEDWLMKNFGYFKAMARFSDFTKLNVEFSGLEVLHLLTPDQCAEMLLVTDFEGLSNHTQMGILRSLESRENDSRPIGPPGPEHNDTSLMKPTYKPPSQEDKIRWVFNDLVSAFKPVGNVVHKFAALTRERKESEMTSALLTQFTLNYALAEMANKYKPQVHEEPGFDVLDVEDWYEQVVMPLLRRFLPHNTFPLNSNIRLAFEKVFYLDRDMDNQDPEFQDVCSITLDKRPCVLTDTVKNVAHVLHCAARADLTLDETTVTWLIHEMLRRMNMLLEELATTDFSELEEEIQEIFTEDDSQSMTEEHLNDPEFIKLWFKVKMMPLLPNISADLLSCLSTKNFSCPVYQTIVGDLSRQMMFMDVCPEYSHNIYQHFIFPFLHDYNTSRCLSNNSAEWMKRNFGFFSRVVKITDFYKLNPHFDPLEVLPQLTVGQLVELVLEDLPIPVDERINKVFDHLHMYPEKFPDFLMRLTEEAATADLSCRDYRLIFKRTYGALPELPPDIEQLARETIEELVSVAPEECLTDDITCPITKFSAAVSCRDVDSSDLEKYLNSSMGISCNFTLEEYACAQLQNFSADHLVSLMMCDLPGRSSRSKILWKMVLTKTFLVLNPALDKLDKMPVGVHIPAAAEILDLIREMRLARLTDDQLKNSSVIGNLFSGGIRKFLPFASEGFLVCLSRRNLSCETFQRIVWVLSSVNSRHSETVAEKFIISFLSRPESGANCSFGLNSTEWLMKNLGSFSKFVTLKKMLELNPNFQPLEVLPHLTPLQLSSLLLLKHPNIPEREILINVLFDFFNKSSDEQGLESFLSYFIPRVGQANFTCSEYRTLLTRLDMVVSPRLAKKIHQYKMEVSKHLPAGCVIDKGTCLVTPVNETEICAGVNSSMVQQHLDGWNLTGHQCRFSVKEIACAKLSMLEADDLAEIMKCHRSANSSGSRATWKLLLTKANHVLNESLDLLGNKVLDPDNPAVSRILDAIQELRVDLFSLAFLNEHDFSQKWLNRKLHPFLAAATPDFLSCLASTDFNCTTYQDIVKTMSGLQPNMSYFTESAVYTHFIKVFLTKNNSADRSCSFNSNSTEEWLVQNLGSFFVFATFLDLELFRGSFSGLEVLNILTTTQLGEMSATPNQIKSVEDVALVMKHVSDEDLIFFCVAFSTALRKHGTDLPPEVRRAWLTTTFDRANLTSSSISEDELSLWISLMVPFMDDLSVEHANKYFLILEGRSCSIEQEGLDTLGSAAPTMSEATIKEINRLITKMLKEQNSVRCLKAGESFYTFLKRSYLVFGFTSLTTSMSMIEPGKKNEILNSMPTSDMGEFLRRPGVVDSYEELCSVYKVYKKTPEFIETEPLTEDLYAPTLDCVWPMALGAGNRYEAEVWKRGLCPVYLKHLNRSMIEPNATHSASCFGFQMFVACLGSYNFTEADFQSEHVYGSIANYLPSTSGVNCSFGLNSTEWLMKNLGSFSKFVTLKKMLELKPNFQPLEVLPHLTPLQLSSLLLLKHPNIPEREILINVLFDFFNKSSDEQGLESFLSYFIPRVGQANFTCSEYRTLLTRLDMVVSPRLAKKIHQYKMEVSKHLPAGCVIDKGTCLVTPVNETEICAGVNSSMVQQHLDGWNLTGHQCRFSVKEIACAKLSMLEADDLAEIMKCHRSANSSGSRATWKLLLTKANHVLNESLDLLGNKVLDPDNPAVSRILDAIQELRVDLFSLAFLNEHDFSQKWLNRKLHPFLAAATPDFLSCLASTDFNCTTYQDIVKTMSGLQPNMSYFTESAVYTHFIKVFLTKNNSADRSCSFNSNSTEEWLVQNLGSFFVFATFLDLELFRGSFSGLEVLNILTTTQLGEMSATPNQIKSVEDVALVMKHVSDEDLIFFCVAFSTALRKHGTDLPPEVRRAWLTTTFDRANLTSSSISEDELSLWISLMVPFMDDLSVEHANKYFLILEGRSCSIEQEGLDTLGSAAPTMSEATIKEINRLITKMLKEQNSVRCLKAGESFYTFLKRSYLVFGFTSLTTSMSMIEPGKKNEILNSMPTSDMGEFLRRPGVVDSYEELCSVYKVYKKTPEFIETEPLTEDLYAPTLDCVWPMALGAGNRYEAEVWKRGLCPVYLKHLNRSMIEPNATHSASCFGFQMFVACLGSYNFTEADFQSEHVYGSIANYLPSTSGVNCSFGLNSTEWLMKNLGSFSKFVTLKKMLELKPNFQPLEVLPHLTPLQLSSLLLLKHPNIPEREILINVLFDFFNKSSDEQGLESFLSYFIPRVGQANFTCSEYRTLLTRLDMVVSPRLAKKIHQYKMEVSKHLPAGCVIDKGTCLVTPVNETEICAGVNSSMVQQHLDGWNLTGHQCRFSVKEIACAKLSMLEADDLAEIMKCHRSANSSGSRATWKLLLTKANHVLNESLDLLGNKVLDPDNPAVSRILDAIQELRVDLFSLAFLNEHDFSQKWLNRKLHPFLAAATPDFLSCLASTDFNCTTYQDIVKTMSGLQPNMSYFTESAVYTHFIKVFLTKNNSADRSCSFNSNSTEEWLVQNLGSFFVFATFLDLELFRGSFSGLEVLNILTTTQLGEMSATPNQIKSVEDVALVMKHVSDEDLIFFCVAFSTALRKHGTDLPPEVRRAWLTTTFDRANLTSSSISEDELSLWISLMVPFMDDLSVEHANKYFLILEGRSCSIEQEGLDTLGSAAPTMSEATIKEINRLITKMLKEQNSVRCLKAGESFYTFLKRSYLVFGFTSLTTSMSMIEPGKKNEILNSMPTSDMGEFLRRPGVVDSYEELCSVYKVYKKTPEFIETEPLTEDLYAPTLDCVWPMALGAGNRYEAEVWKRGLCPVYLKHLNRSMIEPNATHSASCFGFQMFVACLGSYNFTEADFQSEHVYGSIANYLPSTSGVNCSFGLNSTEWLMKNLGSFSKFVTLKKMLELKPNFQPLEVLPHLTPLQLSSLLLLKHPNIPEREILINVLFDFFNKSSDEQGLESFLSYFIPRVGQANFTCSEYRTLLTRLDMVVSPRLAKKIHQYKMEVSKHLPAGCVIDKGTCLVTPVNETEICAGVNSSMVQQHLDGWNLTGHQCRFSVKEIACAKLSMLEADDLAEIMKCHRSANSSGSRATWKLLLTKANHVLNESLDLLGNKVLDPDNPAVSRILDAIQELRVDLFSLAFLNEHDFSQKWLNRKLHPFLAAATPDFLSCLASTDFNCTTYQDIVKTMSGLQPNMSYFTESAVYTHFIKVFLTKNNSADRSCSFNSNSTEEWLVQNLGSFFVFATFLDLELFRGSFSGLEVLNILTTTQLGEMSATPNQIKSVEDVALVMKHVSDEDLIFFCVAFSTALRKHGTDLPPEVRRAWLTTTFDRANLTSSSISEDELSLWISLMVPFMDDLSVEHANKYFLILEGRSCSIEQEGLDTLGSAAPTMSEATIKEINRLITKMLKEQNSVRCLKAGESFYTFLKRSYLVFGFTSLTTSMSMIEPGKKNEILNSMPTSDMGEFLRRPGVVDSYEELCSVYKVYKKTPEFIETEPLTEDLYAPTLDCVWPMALGAGNRYEAEVWKRGLCPVYLKHLNRSMIEPNATHSASCFGFQMFVACLGSYNFTEADFQSEHVYGSIANYLPSTSGVNCSFGLNSTEWLMKNLGSFSKFVTLKKMLELKPNFQPLEVLPHLTPLQLSSLLLLKHPNIPEREILINVLFDFFNKSSDEQGLESFLSYFIPRVGQANFTCSEYRTLLTRLDMVVSPRLAKKIHQYKMEVSKHLPAGCVIDKGTCLVTPVNETEICAGVNSSMVQQHLDGWNLTGHQCRFSVKEIACAKLSMLEADDLAEIMKCHRSANSSGSRATWKLLLTKANHVLNESLDLLGNKVLDPDNPAVSRILDAIQELRVDLFSLAFLNEHDFSQKWLNRKLHPFLAAATPDFLSCLASTDFNCTTYQDIVKTMSGLQPNMSYFTESAVYTHFIKVFLTKNNSADRSCSFNSNSTEEWLVQNLGSFFVFATFLDLELFRGSFSGLEVLNILTTTQLGEMSATPNQIKSVEDVALVMKHVSDEDLIFFCVAFSTALRKHGTDLPPEVRRAWLTTTFDRANLTSSSISEDELSLWISLMVPFMDDLSVEHANKYFLILEGRSCSIEQEGLDTLGSAAPTMSEATIKEINRLITKMLKEQNSVRCLKAGESFYTFLKRSYLVFGFTSLTTSMSMIQPGKKNEILNSIPTSDMGEFLRRPGVVDSYEELCSVYKVYKKTPEFIETEPLTEDLYAPTLDCVWPMALGAGNRYEAEVWKRGLCPVYLKHLNRSMIEPNATHSASCFGFQMFVACLGSYNFTEADFQSEHVYGSIANYLPSTSGVNCSFGLNSTEWLMKNLGSFSKFVTLKKMLELKPNFQPLEVLPHLTPLQLSSLLLLKHPNIPEREILINVLFDFFNKSSDEQGLESFLFYFIPRVGQANFTCSEYRTLLTRLDMVVSPRLAKKIHQYKMEVSKHLPAGCVIDKGTCLVTPVNETEICAGVNSSMVQQHLDGWNLTGHQCRFSVKEIACAKLSMLEADDLAEIMKCHRSANSSGSRATWKLLLTKANHVLNESLDLLGNKVLDPDNPAVSRILDAIQELRVDLFSLAFLNEHDFSQKWLNRKLHPFLAAATPDFLSCLASTDFNCTTYQDIVKTMSGLQPNMSYFTESAVYTHFIKVFLTKNNSADRSCSFNSNSTEEWLVQNLGSFFVFATFLDLELFRGSFSGLEVLNILTTTQLGEMSATPNQIKSVEDVALVMKHVSDEDLIFFCVAFSTALRKHGTDLPPEVRRAWLTTTFDRANLTSSSISEDELSLWISLMVPFMDDLSVEHANKYFLILEGRSCSIEQEGLDTLGSAAPTMSEATIKEINRLITKMLKEQNSVRCLKAGESFYTFLKRSYLVFGFPSLTTSMSMIEPGKKNEILNSMPTSDMGEFLRRPGVVDSYEELCSVYKVYKKTPEFIETEPLTEDLYAPTLDCVWPMALGAGNRYEAEVWKRVLGPVYLKHLNRSMIEPNATHSASCFGFQMFVACLGSYNFTEADFQSEHVYGSIANYLPSTSAPKCYNSSHPELNSTAWFVNYIGGFLPSVTVENLASFGPDEEIALFTVNPENMALLNSTVIPADLNEFYTYLIYLHDPEFSVLNLPLPSRCFAPGALFYKLNKKQSEAILEIMRTHCTDLDPQIIAALAGNFDTDITASTISTLGNECTGFATGTLSEIASEEMFKGRFRLGLVPDWNMGQVSAIIRVLRKWRLFQINGASLIDIGTLVRGITGAMFSKMSSSDILTASAHSGFLTNLNRAPAVARFIATYKLVQLNNNSEQIITNVPDELAAEIPASLLLNLPDNTDVKERLNKKNWTSSQAELFFSLIGSESSTAALGSENNLSSNVLQGFTCTSVRTFKKTQIKKLIKACRRKKKNKVKLVESQLTCMYNNIKGDTDVTTYTDFPEDMLLYYDYSLVPKASCKDYFQAISEADFSIFSPALGYMRNNLMSNALGCLGTTGTNLTKENVQVLGNMCCYMNSNFIQSADPYVLEVLKDCEDLTEDQAAAAELLLLSGKTSFSDPKKWEFQTLKSMNMLPLYMSSSFYGSIRKRPKKKFLKYFFRLLRRRGMSRKKRRMLKRKFKKNRSKRDLGSNCVVGNITYVIITSEDFPLQYTDVTEFDNCLSAAMVEHGLGEIMEKVDQEDYLTVVLKKLHELYPSTVPEIHVAVLGAASIMATPDDIAKWTITEIDTLGALLSESNGEVPLATAQAIINNYLAVPGNTLGITELNAIGGLYLCSLDNNVLANISADAVNEAKSLNIDSCTQEKKNILFAISQTAFETKTRSTISPSSYQLTRSYTGGAPLEYIRSLANSNINMEVDKFSGLNPKVLTELSIDEVSNLLGANLADLALYQNEAGVQTWIKNRYQINLDKLGLGLTGGKATPSTTKPAATTKKVTAAATKVIATTKKVTARTPAATTKASSNHVKADASLCFILLLTLLITRQLS